MIYDADDDKEIPVWDVHETPLPCIICGGPVIEIKCKVICTKCGALNENCNRD